ncbi:MAG TPA: TlyA family RNA methyltransferase [Dehalococcoidia bacterium]|jgi:23S rRNA (cytidine1920-2'-O)/16S rRNA (cytidine1409-2'-O)-methyltransferase|nr:TlyA family RNA methyltransferase [Dehalococcoidia bacterium]
MAKRRLDTLLVDRGLAESPEKARALVMAGAVSVDERPAPKAGTLVDEEAPVRVAEPARYVGRGGEKLEHALDAFGLGVRGLVAADVGASTGGFTDCLLQRGVSRAYAIDVGKGQLDYGLRNDPRVVVMEGVNARNLESLPEPVDLVTIDVSFISLRLVLPAAAVLFDANRSGEGPFAPTPARGSIVVLLKPQFEAAKSEVPRGGVIRDAQLHATLIGRFAAWCVANCFRIIDLTSSPILGADGNREFFFWLRPDVGGCA